jgi:hypothetical protein
MLEIVALIFISKHMAEMAHEKGYSTGLYRFLTFLFWLGFEFIGAIVGIIYFGDEEPMIYLFMLVFAGLGYLILYVVVSRLPDLGIPTEPVSYEVRLPVLPVYEKATESSRIIREYLKGDIIDIDTMTDFNQFYKVQISPGERGFVVKTGVVKKY